jgi:cytochrome c5
MINVSGIYKNNSWDDWKTLCNACHEYQIDAIFLPETNLKWNPKIQQIASLMHSSSHKGTSLPEQPPPFSVK